MRLRRKQVVITAAVVVGLGAASAAALPVRSAILTAQACDTMTTYLEEEGAIQTIGDGPLKVTVLGDSYSSGDALPERADRWTTTYADLADATVTLDAIGMTGYVNGGYCGDQAFTTRTGTLARPADLVILQGGINDWQARDDDLRKAAATVLDAVPKHTPVVVVGPALTEARGTPSAVDNILADAAQIRGFDYVSTLDWKLPLLPDGLHMTAAGHVQYAEKLYASWMGSSHPR